MINKIMDRLYPYFIIAFLVFFAILIAHKIGDNYYTKGVTAAKNGDFEAAVSWFDLAGRLKSKDLKIFFARANAFSELSRIYAKKSGFRSESEAEEAKTMSEDYAFNAREDYDSAIKLNPKRMDYYYKRAINKQDNNSDQAIADFSIVLRMDPNNAEILYNRGYSYFSSGKYSLAIADFSKVISLKPDYAEAFCSRGAAYFFRNYGNKSESDYLKAMSDFNTAIKLKPSYSQAYYYRSLAYSKKKDFIHAIADQKKQLSLDPSQEGPYFGLSSLYFESGDYKNAVAVISEYITHNPRSGDAYNARATYYDKMERKDAAKLDRVKAKSLLSN